MFSLNPRRRPRPRRPVAPTSARFRRLSAFSRVRFQRLSSVFGALILASLLATACDGLDAPLDSPSGSGDTGTQHAQEGTVGVSALEGLTVAQAHSMSGYSRDRFPHWKSTGKNCDVRDTVLERDGKNIDLDGCNVTGGEWYSVYDAVTFTEPLKVDIDHMVPLADAWRSGADTWTDDKRSEFANDLDRPQLFAVSASSNRSKGDQDPSQWKPPSHDYWCQYAQDWITVKAYWHLSVTRAERDALRDMLATCP